MQRIPTWLLAAVCALLMLALYAGLYSALAEARVVVEGRTSWFGGPCDHSDNNRTATGLANTMPGIALFRRDTFGAWFALRRPRTGRQVVVRHVDLGPAPWTGKRIDLNPVAARGLGFRAPGGCVQGFPTGERMSVRRVSRREASRLAARTRTRVDDRWVIRRR